MFFTLEKVEKQLKDIRKTVYRQVIPIQVFKARVGECSGAESLDYDDSTWQDFQTGNTWGGYDITAWFRAWVKVPAELAGHKLALHLLVGPRDGGESTAESLLYINGHPLQGIDVWHTEAWLPPEEIEKGEFLLALKAWSGVLGVPEKRRFVCAELAWIDEDAEAFCALAGNLAEAVKVQPEGDLRRVQLLQALNEAFLAIDFLKPGSQAFYNSIAEARHCLEGKLASLGHVAEIRPVVTGVGHAHIDLAWLWRLQHSREKAARTFSTALHLMRQYPEYVFMHSSPQLYKFLKQDYPELYERVKEKIRSGQWEIEGGMWVEADTNLTSGESLVRQLLLGKRFIREEFGIDMQTLWLPDVFGYSAALPQIMRKSGIRRFMTTKISWSQFNRFPYDTFNWRGLDGSEVLTHFVTTPDAGSPFFTYNGQISASEVKGIWENYHQKEINSELLLLFGWGDGGGGPTKDMLESARAFRKLPGLPEVRLGKAGEYFDRLQASLVGKDIPTWDGELYLEYHRGTYTSQAANKRANRQSELLFHDAEWLASMADILNGTSLYPADALREAWELILLNQFHDVLPGSSIRQVYEDSQVDYAKIRYAGELVVNWSSLRVQNQMRLPTNSLVVWNTLSWQRSGLVELPYNVELATQAELPVQQVQVGDEKKLLVEVKNVPTCGYQAYPLAETAQPVGANWQAVQQAGTVRGFSRSIPTGGDAPFPEIRPELNLFSDGDLKVQADYLENSYYRIEINPLGQIVRLWDKRQQREVLVQGGRGNVFQVFEDMPMKFDAWDIDIYYQEKMREIADLVEAVAEEVGPLRGVLRLRWRFADSEITQRLTIYRYSPRIDFRTEVDWREHQVLLKVAFPVEVRATRATYDVQFGSLERPTHWNTSWDTARFESVGHKWVDLSEGNYGVALLNDCKYGHDVKDNVMRLTLIKSAVQPDAQADQGRHVFTYALLPHAGDWRTARVVQEAYELNVPLRASQVESCQNGSLPISLPFAQVDDENVILETLKHAEEGDGWIVRLYECAQSRSQAVNVEFGLPLRKAVECNLMEEDEQSVDFAGRRLIFPIKPFEIKTFKVWFAELGMADHKS